MPLSWNEIKDRSLSFSKEWATESSEDAEAKTFWDSFFNVFGVTRRRIASFEVPAKKSDGHGGYIDLLWKGILVVEHKSRGKNLDKAFHQAVDYFPGLKERDLPRYVLVSDFANFRLYDLEKDEKHEFHIEDLYKNVRLFGFIAGYQTRSFGQQDPVNVEAAERLGKLHDLLFAAGYKGHQLEILLVRLLFGLFAEDTSIFERRNFQDYLEIRTSEDGSDLGMHLAQLFQVLNTPEKDRMTNLDEQLNAFRYVNGKLFAETLPVASFDKKMRETLLDCCGLDWSRINPAIFGSLFQSIMDKNARRNLGAHYTTETNILKLLRPLFLDELHTEFSKIKRNPKQLVEFHKKLANIRILDPACGCGNFLIIAYRELRLLELEVLRELYKAKTTGFLNVSEIVLLDVDQFYGIEKEEFPAQIAQVALWLMDHQMNLRVSEEFGQYFTRLPLSKSANIVNKNALTIDWKQTFNLSNLTYIIGNPPFVGKSYQTKEQKAELEVIWGDVHGSGVLDYVTCWYRKAAEMMLVNPSIRTAFVSTNSITQGEQVPILWNFLIQKGIKINFAHRTFQWTSEARGKAAVHCIILGLGTTDDPVKKIYDYDDPKSEAHEQIVKQINPYLVEASNIMVAKRRDPLCNVPRMLYGSKPVDNGNLILDEKSKADLLLEEPQVKKWIRPFIGTDEFLYNQPRWCLWLVEADPSELKKSKPVIERISKVKTFRSESKKIPTQNAAATPSLFMEIRQPEQKYLAVPEVSSENRIYIPVGFLDKEVVASNKIYTVANANLYHFGIVTSLMHMAWMRATAGRLESRYQYSSSICYNNFPWPETTEKQRENIETAAQSILDARAKYPSSTLADLYDPISMPPELIKAHQKLDKEVDSAYGKTFTSEAGRVAYLFDQYEKITAPLNAAKSKSKRSKKASATPTN